MGYRLLLLSEPIPPYHRGGAGKLALNLATELVNRRHEVDLVCVNTNREFYEIRNGLRVHWVRAEEYGWTKITFATRLKRVLPFLIKLHRNRHFDLVHDVCGFLYSDVVRALVEETKLPTVTHLLLLMGPYLVETGRASEYAGFFHQQQIDQCAASQAVITTSRAESALYRGLIGSSPKDTVIHNPVVVPQPDVDKVKRMRNLLSKAQDDLILFVGGRLTDRVKGGDRAIALAAYLNRIGFRAQLLVTNLGKENRHEDFAVPVHNLGRLNEEELAVTLSAADFVLCPSRYEAFGLLGVESGALGTPVLASNTGGHLDTMGSVVGGKLICDEEWFEPSDEIVECILQRRSGWHYNGAVHVPAPFQMSTIIVKIEELYAKLGG